MTEDTAIECLIRLGRIHESLDGTFPSSRERIATAMMLGVLTMYAAPEMPNPNPADAAELAICYTDALIVELAKSKS